MNEYIWLAVYSLLIMAFAFVGAYLPFIGGQVSHSRLQFYLTFSAGVMLGAAFFHVMPDAMDLAKDNFGWWMSLGVVGLFCIERFLAPHTHEIDGEHQSGQVHPEPDLHEHEHTLEHTHNHRNGPEQKAAAPALAGWMAVLGLTIHTFMNGVGLAGAVRTDITKHVDLHFFGLTLAIPGLAMFGAIFFHKPADALAISTVLSRKKVSRNLLTLVQIGFVAMVPVGAFLFCLTEGSLEEGMRIQLTGAALAFSAGTFLFVALSDLLPEVQFHRHDRIPLFLTLVSGVILMGFIAFLEDLGKEKNGEGKEGNSKAAVSARLTVSSDIQSPPRARRH